MIVVIEGMTNAGKSTMCQYIDSELRRRNIASQVLATRDDLVVSAVSGITNPLEHKDAIDARSELMLYTAILCRKRELIENVVRSAPVEILLVDRFALSVFCFFVYVRALPRDAVRSCVDLALNGLTPDVTLFLDVSLKTATARARNSPFSRKDIGIDHYWKALRDGFLNELDQFSISAHAIDADNTNPDAIVERLISTIDTNRTMHSQM